MLWLFFSGLMGSGYNELSALVILLVFCFSKMNKQECWVSELLLCDQATALSSMWRGDGKGCNLVSTLTDKPIG